MHLSDLAGAAALTIALSFSPLAWAEVGAVASLEGESIRMTTSGESVALGIGSKIELGDTLEVKTGNLKLSLTDESEIALASGSKLRIDEAEFKELDHRRFSATLFLGSLWSRVNKALAGSDAKFEIATDRVVAGVRGTTFRVDVVAVAGTEKETLVHVLEGRVGVADRAARAPKFHELSAGETARANKEGVKRERGKPPTKESFERFIRAHERDTRNNKERPRNRERGPRHK